jgi:hypothetical protein
VTRYELFRRRIVPVAIVVVFALLAFETCNKQERTQASFVIECGEYAKVVRSIEAELWMNGERVGRFVNSANEGAYLNSMKFQASLPDTTGEMRIVVDLGGGQLKHLTRKIHVREGDTVTVNLEPDLRESRN